MLCHDLLSTANGNDVSPLASRALAAPTAQTDQPAEKIDGPDHETRSDQPPDTSAPKGGEAQRANRRANTGPPGEAQGL
eukprot:4657268-Karenia_brevis.AAC.1